VRPLRRHPRPVKAACVMMLRFQWDSLRRGDHVLVHDVRTADLGLRPAVVELVDTGGSHHDVAVRYSDGPDAGRIVRPGRFATHPDPLSDAVDCWRCAEAQAG
jgi:hypothetical protein